jgi:hypothetical protein
MERDPRAGVRGADNAEVARFVTSIWLIRSVRFDCTVNRAVLFSSSSTRSEWLHRELTAGRFALKKDTIAFTGSLQLPLKSCAVRELQRSALPVQLFPQAADDIGMAATPE